MFYLNVCVCLLNGVIYIFKKNPKTKQYMRKRLRLLLRLLLLLLLLLLLHTTTTTTTTKLCLALFLGSHFFEFLDLFEFQKIKQFKKK